jgi:hypothetical protein
MSPGNEGEKAMSKMSRVIVAAGVSAALIIGLNPASAAGKLPLSLCDPTRHEFTASVTNEYFPLQPGQVSTFFGDDEGEPLGLRIAVTNQTETLYAGTDHEVITLVVVETEWADEDEDGKIDQGEDLIEISTNYFAQTEDGTVCYFGEEVTIFLDGGGTSDAGSWRADEPGNGPGVFMPAVPQKGQRFQIESAPGVAMDEATIKAVRTVILDGEAYEQSIQVKDCNPLEKPTDCGIKYYAPGVGLIVDGPVELTGFEAG